MGIGCLNFDGKMTKLAFFLFCGLFGSSLAIFGGRDTTRNQYPFVVAIQEKITKQIICMGAIKNNFWIVTSAGCCQAFNNDAANMRVVAGVHNFARFEVNRQYRDVENMFQHPVGETHDICLMQLTKPLDLTSRAVGMANLSAGDELEGEAVSMGWGYTGWGKPIILRSITINTVPTEECVKAYNIDAERVDKVICAGAPHKSVCDGDFGGPLIHKATGQDIGIALEIPKCGGDVPALYTKISAYTNWMDGILKLNPNPQMPEEVDDEDEEEESGGWEWPGFLTSIGDVFDGFGEVITDAFLPGKPFAGKIRLVSIIENV